MLNNAPPGPGNVSSYQVSAIPWVTSSSVSGVKYHTFDINNNFFLSKWIVVTNLSGSAGSMRVAFTQRGFTSNNCFTLAPGESFSGDLRIPKLFLSGTANYELIAGLTGISARHQLDITGSNGYPGVG